MASGSLKDAITETLAITEELMALQRRPREEQGAMMYQLYEQLVGSECFAIVSDAIISLCDEIHELEQLEKSVNMATDPVRGLSLYPPQEAAKEHPTPTPLVRELYETDMAVECAWGCVVLFAVNQFPEEEEDHEEMVMNFERTLQRHSPYLRAMLLHSSSALDVISLYQLHNSETTVDVVMAALHKHPPKNSNEICELVRLMASNHLSITVRVGEALEKAFVRCMKAEGAEFVFHRMISECRLVPFTTRPFAMLFNAPRLEKVDSVQDYYELMLDYGIRPELSVLRILCKRSMGEEEYVRNHFTYLSKLCESSSSGNPQAEDAAARSSSAVEAADGGAYAGDSLRRHPYFYFVRRLERLADVPTPRRSPLLEGMKVLRRIEVEGAPRHDFLIVVKTILWLFCYGSSWSSDLILPFSQSKAYSPVKVVSVMETLDEADLRSMGGQAEWQHVSHTTNAYDFNLSEDAEELLEAEGSSRSSSASLEGEEALEPLEGQTTKKAAALGVASIHEEAEYVLNVMKELYQWKPDERLLMATCEALFEGKNVGNLYIELLDVLTFAIFRVCHESQGLAQPIYCYCCVELCEEFIRSHQKQRVSDLLAEIATQYYEYIEVFQKEWCVVRHLNQYRRKLDNERALWNLITLQIRTGRNVEWCLGLLVWQLTATHGPVSRHAKKRLLGFIADPVVHRTATPHARVIAELRRCDWERTRIFASKFVMRGVETEGSAESEQMGSRGGSRGAPDERRTLDDYLHVMMRDLKLQRPVIDWYRERLASLDVSDQ